MSGNISNSKPKVRILALHGGMSCAKKFKSGAMKQVIRSLKDIAELEFVDAPFMTRCPIFEGSNISGYDEELSDQKRSWWNWNYHDPNDNRYAVHGYTQEGLFYHGLDNSLNMLDRLWTTAQEDGKPFHGIFGFSQGAITASVFADWMTRNAKDNTMLPRFLILVSAFLKPVPLNYPEYWVPEDDADSINSLKESYSMLMRTGTLPSCFPLDIFQKENPSGFDPSDANDLTTWATIHGGQDDMAVASEFYRTKTTISNIPSLHVFGIKDTIMPNSRSMSLAQRYVGSQVYEHSFKRGHDVPSDVESIATFRNFIEKQQELL